MTRKSSSVKKIKPKVAIEPAQAKARNEAHGKPRARALDSKSIPADVKRQLKIQQALYAIADAASAVKDMQSFYKKLHKIVGKLMYAENFFIALHDKQSDLITWVYYVDTVDVEPYPPTKLSDFHEIGRAHV